MATVYGHLSAADGFPQVTHKLQSYRFAVTAIFFISAEIHPSNISTAQTKLNIHQSNDFTQKATIRITEQQQPRSINAGRCLSLL